MISPLSVIWLPWLQLLLLATLCLSFAANPRQLEGVVADFLSAHMQRRYAEATPSYTALVSIAFFRMGVLALAIYMLLYALVPSLPLSMPVYWAAVGIVAIVYVVRRLLQAIVQYVFMWGNVFTVSYNHHRRMGLSVSLVLFALLLCQQWLTPRGLVIGMAVIGVIYVILLLVRAGRTFLVRPLAALYIVIYLATLELLPAIAMAACVYSIAMHV